MARVTVRQTNAELPDLPDRAELARVESLGASGGSVSRFELTGSRFRNSIEIGAIADQVRRGANRSHGGWGQKVDRSGSQTDNDQRTAHSRLP